jgi:hypothetical protein
MEPSATFCILPWMHAFADEQGVMWPCCRSVGSGQPNLEDDSGLPVRIDRAGGIIEAMNTRTMRDLRVSMLAGQQPAACERCYMVEKVGIKSHRVEENERRRAEIPGLLQATHAEGRLAVDLRTADIRLGNKCNLRCRMCSPQSSAALLPEWAEKHGVPLDHECLDIYHNMSWFEEPQFWQSLEAQAPHLERINFAGGEPLLIAPMFDFMERMVAAGRARELTISYNTNLTVLPKRALALWPQFRAIRVTASIDGVGEVNDFIRHPSHWPIIDAHLRKLDRDYDALNLGAGLATNTAVQIYNVFRLGELLDHLAHSTSRLELPNLSIVTQPEHLSVRILPPALKSLARARLLDAIEQSGALWRDRWGTAAADLCAAVQGIVSYMDAADRSELLAQFLEWSCHQDRFRNHSTPESIPELAPLFGVDPANARVQRPHVAIQPEPTRVR